MNQHAKPPHHAALNHEARFAYVSLIVVILIFLFALIHYLRRRQSLKQQRQRKQKQQREQQQEQPLPRDFLLPLYTKASTPTQREDLELRASSRWSAEYSNVSANANPYANGNPNPNAKVSWNSLIPHPARSLSRHKSGLSDRGEYHVLSLHVSRVHTYEFGIAQPSSSNEDSTLMSVRKNKDKDKGTNESASWQQEGEPKPEPRPWPR